MTVKNKETAPTTWVTDVKVMATTDYDQFKEISGQRPRNKTHIAKLIKSMDRKQLTIPAVVNEKYEVVDGQHRLEVCTQLNVPYYFIIHDGATAEDMEALNAVQDKWKNRDFIHLYDVRARAGSDEYKDYPVLVDFMENHDLKVAEANSLLNGGVAMSNGKINDGAFVAQFGNGLPEYWLNGYKDILATMDDPVGVKSTSFMKALILTMRVADVKLENLEAKLCKMERELKSAGKVEDYLTVIEKAHNRGRGKSIGISAEVNNLLKRGVQ